MVRSRGGGSGGEGGGDAPPQAGAVSGDDEEVAGRADAGGLALAGVIDEGHMAALPAELRLVDPAQALVPRRHASLSVLPVL